MRRFFKMVCSVTLLLVMVGCFMTPAFAVNDIRYSSYHNMTASEIQRIVDETVGTQIDRFDYIIANYDVLATYGTIPEKAQGVEAYENWIQMTNISRALADDEVLQRYYYESGGPIIGHGTQCVCFLSFVVLDERAHNFTENDMIIIKERADYYASFEGIDDVPMIFFREPMVDSYLTEEQFLYLYDSGSEGITITGGLENITALRDKFDSVSLSSSSNDYAFDDEGFADNASLTDRLLAFLRSLFGGSENTTVLSSKSDLEGLATEKVRPIVGGVRIATATSGGTIGYTARDSNNSSLRGIATVAHVFHFENATSYQPRQAYGDSNTIGTFSKMSKEGDSVFIPMDKSDVRAAIYTGEGDDQLLDVIGYEGTLSGGMPLSKSGANSGNTEGTYFGIRYNQTFSIKNGTITYTVNKVGIVQESSKESYSVPGDSGGPIYVKTKTTVNDKEQDAAVLLGILEGGDGNGTVYYVPCTAIQERLGIVPLTINDI